jgi:hypothetical protein
LLFAARNFALLQLMRFSLFSMGPIRRKGVQKRWHQERTRTGVPCMSRRDATRLSRAHYLMYTHVPCTTPDRRMRLATMVKRNPQSSVSIPRNSYSLPHNRDSSPSQCKPFSILWVLIASSSVTDPFTALHDSHSARLHCLRQPDTKHLWNSE